MSTARGLLWALLNDYEEHLKLLQPIDPVKAIETTDIFKEPGSMAVVESGWGTHEFQGEVEIRAKRQMPQNINVGLTLNLQLPRGIDANQLPDALKETLQQLINQAQQALTEHATVAVQEALKAQAPVAGLDVALRGGAWTKTD